MEPNIEKSTSLYSKCAVFSILAGLMGLTMCCYPPAQLVFGAAAILLAYVSREGRPLTTPARIGTVFGMIAVILSLVIFAWIVLAYKVMDDPANTPMIRDIFKQYKDILSSTAAG